MQDEIPKHKLGGTANRYCTEQVPKVCYLSFAVSYRVGNHRLRPAWPPRMRMPGNFCDTYTSAPSLLMFGKFGQYDSQVYETGTYQCTERQEIRDGFTSPHLCHIINGEAFPHRRYSPTYGTCKSKYYGNLSEEQHWTAVGMCPNHT